MKTFGAVLLGYLTMAVLVFVSYTCLYAAIGTEGAFMTKSFAVSLPWLILSLALALGAALGGGFVAQKIGADDGSIWLIIVIVLLGIGLAVTKIGAPAAPERSGEIGPIDAMVKAVTPAWASFVNAILSGVGAAIGAKLAKRSAK